MKPSIICHRGVWKKKSEQNSWKSAFDAYQYDGLEIDLKNYLGDVILSHDPVIPDTDLIFLEDILESFPDTFYALDIKESGIEGRLADLIKKYNIQNYMCFDLALPDVLHYRTIGLNVYGRFGDEDTFPHRKEHYNGFVIDVFNDRNWSSIWDELHHLKINKPLFFISPELHQHSHSNMWEVLRTFSRDYSHEIFLCTDLPDDASRFFRRGE